MLGIIAEIMFSVIVLSYNISFKRDRNGHTVIVMKFTPIYFIRDYIEGILCTIEVPLLEFLCL